ncbi:MAG: hypothetical protein EBU01_15785, partial [Crocinitomicaceae bacterium]|nr:hypothetical protein [Crocinitomicaceae bacterium]
EHIKRIADTYWKFKDVDGFAKTISNKEVLSEQKGNLSIQLYVKPIDINEEHELDHLIETTKTNQKEINKNIDSLFLQLKKLGIE